jgi:Coenzyme PQQ synthesis protein D (PqqD)
MEFTLNPELSIRKIEKETFVFNRKDCQVHSFNRSGTFLWEIVQKSASHSAAVDAMFDEYDVDRQTAEKDVREFLDNLVDIGLIEKS